MPSPCTHLQIFSSTLVVDDLPSHSRRRHHHDVFLSLVKSTILGHVVWVAVAGVDDVDGIDEVGWIGDVGGIDDISGIDDIDGIDHIGGAWCGSRLAEAAAEAVAHGGGLQI